MSIKQQVLDTINRVYYNGLTTTSGGNISAIDSEGTIYITPSSIDKGTLKIDDLVEVTPQGELRGKHKPSIELPFHSNIYKLRTDVKAVVHAHAPAVVAYATARKIPNSDIAPIYKELLGNITGSRYDIPGSISLGNIIKDEFVKGYDCVMMDNHGATVGGDSLEHAYCRYEALDNCCLTMINAEILGGVKYAKRQGDYGQVATVTSCQYSQKENEVAEEICAFLKRSYKQKLVSESYGTLAVKLENGDILFNSDKAPRSCITTNDIIKYSKGSISQDVCVKYLGLITQIFDKTPEAVTVFISMPPYAMGFSVAHVELNSRLIPESYIMLKDVQSCKAGEDKNVIASKLTTKSPAVIIENECIVTIGKNIVKAFDRMEVIEYSAKSIIMAKQVAKIIPINENETQDIDRVFNGW